MALIDSMSLDERETHLNLTASDRNTWHVFSDDPVMQRRIEKLGIEPTKVESSGGKHYELPANQLTLRKARKISAEERERLSEQARRVLAPRV